MPRLRENHLTGDACESDSRFSCAVCVVLGLSFLQMAAMKSVGPSGVLRLQHLHSSHRAGFPDACMLEPAAGPSQICSQSATSMLPRSSASLSDLELRISISRLPLPPLSDRLSPVASVQTGPSGRRHLRSLGTPPREGHSECTRSSNGRFVRVS